MINKQLVALLAAAVIFSTAIGFAFGQAGQPDPAKAAGNSSVVKQLKKANSYLNKIDISTELTCENTGGNVYDCQYRN